MTGNCGYPEGVEHLHVERCYEGGRRDALAELGADVTVEVQWAIDYPDPTPPMLAESEWRARSWATYWNTHRSAGDAEAVVMSRVVTTSAWEPAAEEDAQ